MRTGLEAQPVKIIKIKYFINLLYRGPMQIIPPLQDEASAPVVEL
jgi:hypothetical protein